MDTDDLFEKVMEWGENHKLTNPKAQLNKVLEELGEVAHEVTRNRYDTDAFRDGIGDTLVTIIILANITGNDPRECLRMAYDEIKDRVGITEEDTFIKD